MNKVINILFLFLLAMLSGNSFAAGQNVPLGMNISLSRYYSPQLAFVDVFKQTKEWIPQSNIVNTWDTGEALDLDENGWIRSLKDGQAAGTIMLNSLDGHYPTGQYICLYDGQGSLSFGRDAKVVSTSPGRIVLDVTPTNSGIYMKLTNTDPSNPVRNIRVIMPGHEASYKTQPFNPVFLERLKGFKILRFMRWGVNNTSYYTGWDGRATPAYYSQATNKDVAIEHMIQLANTIKADAWFSIPHQADDTYMREFARLVRDTLDPSLKAYVEYTNEVWNSVFPQSTWATEQGLALGLSTNKTTARVLYYSKRAGELFKIWEQEFGGTDRIVRTLGAMAANPWVAKTMLGYGDTGAHTDAVAIAPYFGGRLGKESAATIGAMTADDVFSYLADDIDRVMQNVAGNKVEANKFGVKLIAYEGGQHLAPSPVNRENATINALFIGVNRDPRMGELYKDYLSKWELKGGGAFVMFDNVTAFTKFGSWGVQEYQDQPIEEAHKLRALQTYMGSGVLVCN